MFLGKNDSKTPPKKVVQAFDAFEGDRFGRRLHLCDTRLAVSAHRDDDLGWNSGAVYFYNLEPNASVGATWVYDVDKNDPLH